MQDASSGGISGRHLNASVATLVVACGLSAVAAEPPAPFGPVPGARQLHWQEMKFAGFLHFSINTFAGHDWGNCRRVRCQTVTTDKIRLCIAKAPVCPAISEIGLFAEPADPGK
jgi:hypothetical protein